MNWGAVLSSVAFRVMAFYVLGLSLLVFLVMVLLYGIFTRIWSKEALTCRSLFWILFQKILASGCEQQAHQ